MKQMKTITTDPQKALASLITQSWVDACFLLFELDENFFRNSAQHCMIKIVMEHADILKEVDINTKDIEYYLIDLLH